MKNFLIVIAILITIPYNAISQNCQAGFNYNSSGLSVQFLDSSFSATGIYNSSWSFGNGIFSTATNPTHTFAQAGTYNVCLTISDSVCIDSICYNVTVQGNVPSCSANFQTIINGLSVQFLDSSITSSNANSYAWNFGDSSFSFLQNPNHTYNTSGTYLVALSIYDSVANCSSIKYDTITVQSSTNCLANFSYLVSSDSLMIQNLADSNLMISYSFGDGNFSSQTNPTHIYAASGNYIVCQTVTDSINCFSTFCDTVQITIAPPCRADFTFNQNDFTVDILNRASNYNSILYDFGDGFMTSTPNPTHLYSSNGTYVICQTVYGNSGCVDTYCDSVFINVPPPCAAGFNYRSNFTTVDFFNRATNYDSISYNFGDGKTSYADNPTHTYATSGTFIVNQTVSNINGCSSVFTDTITVQAPPPCRADFSFAFFGDTTQFTSLATNYSRLIYHFGDGNISTSANTSHLYTNSGTYSVKLVVFNDSTGCSDSITKLVSVTVSQSCVAKFELALDTNQRDILFLVNTSSSDNTHNYFWDFGDGNTSTLRLPNHQYSNNQAYNICLTVADSIQNCSSTYCDSVGLDTNGNILKSNGFRLKVLNGSFIGVEELEYSLQSSVKVFPNPFINELSLQVERNYNSINYQLVDTRGKLLQQGRVNSGVSTLPFDNIPSGLYFLRIQYEKEHSVIKLIKH